MFYLFNEDANYTTEDGKPCALADHLRYLRTWGGTPDCWAYADTKNEARKMAFYSAPKGKWLIVSDLLDFRPVGRVEK